MDLNLAVGRQGSIGKLVAHTEARLTETETGLDVSAGQPGELWVQSPSVMKGYLRNPEATKKTFSEDGWFKTGDVAVVTDDGYF
jgi:4-coumarate--CoA ligase